MKQLSFLDDSTPTYRPPAVEARQPVAVARKSDPATSHKAADLMNSTGAVKGHCALILEALRRIGSATSGEIAGNMRLNLKSAEWVAHKILKRMPDLVRGKSVVKVGERTCSIEETSMTVYALAGSCCAQPDAQVIRDGEIFCKTCRHKLSGG